MAGEVQHNPRKLPPERRKKIEREAQELREELSLAKLRGAMELTQQALNNALRFTSRRWLGWRSEPTC